MPYPMIQCPTFEEFRDRLISEFRCAYESLDNPLVNNLGIQSVVRFFEREIPDKGTKQCVVQIDNDKERILPSHIRSICRRLEIPPAAFGLTLG